MRLIQSLKQAFTKNSKFTILKSYERKVVLDLVDLYRTITVTVFEGGTEPINSVKAQSYLVSNKGLFAEVDAAYTAEIVVRDLAEIINSVEVLDYEKSHKTLKINVTRG